MINYELAFQENDMTEQQISRAMKLSTWEWIALIIAMLGGCWALIHTINGVKDDLQTQIISQDDKWQQRLLTVKSDIERRQLELTKELKTEINTLRANSPQPWLLDRLSKAESDIERLQDKLERLSERSPPM